VCKRDGTGGRRVPPALVIHRESLWQAWRRFTFKSPLYHVNLVGVRRSHAGDGVGRWLLDRVHDASGEDAGSRGVSLTTDDPANVALYQHLGYTLSGPQQVSDALQTWGFFRGDLELSPTRP